MPRKRANGSGGSAAADPRAELVGRYLGVPTSFFNVEVDGARYLARVKAPHKEKKDMLWMKFAQADNFDEAYAPLDVVRKWLITDEEALDPKADWYEDPEDDASRPHAVAALASPTLRMRKMTRKVRRKVRREVRTENSVRVKVWWLRKAWGVGLGAEGRYGLRLSWCPDRRLTMDAACPSMNVLIGKSGAQGSGL